MVEVVSIEFVVEVVGIEFVVEFVDTELVVAIVVRSQLVLVAQQNITAVVLYSLLLVAKECFHPTMACFCNICKFQSVQQCYWPNCISQ